MTSIRSVKTTPRKKNPMLRKILPILALSFAASSIGCVVEATPQPFVPRYGCVEYCDADNMCRDVCDVHYYFDQNGAVFYYDQAYGWVGPRGYWHNGGWVGFPGGWHEQYRGYWHSHERFSTGRGGERGGGRGRR